ncbi:MAG: dimethylarginine dimethylaminohydrolase family protein [Gemmatimonadaceae bacterium]
MPFRFTRAIVRAPSPNFADGLTSVTLGRPDYARALEQHARYCEALARCGLKITRLAEDPAHPDATFVEDTAVLSARCNVLTRPGAPSRAGEVTSIRAALVSAGLKFGAIDVPGTLDGGDICEHGDHFFIGVSQRTNWEGAAQLAACLTQAGCESSCIDIRAVPGILHLKSGIASLDDDRIVALDALLGHAALRGREIVRVPQGEEYAANCVRVNDHLLMPAGFPRMHDALDALGYSLIPLDMSEFEKMDGGLSCLSLRF